MYNVHVAQDEEKKRGLRFRSIDWPPQDHERHEQHQRFDAAEVGEEPLEPPVLKVRNDMLLHVM